MNFPDRYRLLGLVEVPPTWIGVPGVVRDIHNQVSGALYLRRVYLAPNLYLHKIAQADADRHLHNHPWRWAWSYVIKGGYLEQRHPREQQGSYTRELRRGATNLLRAGDYHRIRTVRPGTWTLFLTGKRASSWGFWTRQGHVDHEVYFQ
jgi:hypothetical protein